MEEDIELGRLRVEEYGELGGPRVDEEGCWRRCVWGMVLCRGCGRDWVAAGVVAGSGGGQLGSGLRCGGVVVICVTKAGRKENAKR